MNRYRYWCLVCELPFTSPVQLGVLGSVYCERCRKLLAKIKAEALREKGEKEKPEETDS